MAVGSVQGPFRERNEDRAVVAELALPNRLAFRLGIVCDGMGGLSSGQEAASRAIAAFIAFLVVDESPLDERLLRACHRSNDVVHNVFFGDGGATLTAIAVTQTEAFAVHVGDSRLYTLTRDGTLTLESVDDTVAGAVKAGLGEGDEDELDNRLLQFIGIGEPLHPHVLRFTVDAPVQFLITSDGAHGLGRRVLDGLVRRPKSPADLVRKLVYVADALNVTDNATAVCISNRGWDNQTSFEGGTGLAIWSPTQHIEIWLPGEDGAPIQPVRPKPGTKKARQRISSPSTDDGEDSTKVKRSPIRLKKSKRSSKRTEADTSPMDVLFKIGDGSSND